MLLLQLSTDMLGEGIAYTAIGFSVVLIVLLLITLVLYIFSAIVNMGNKGKKENTKAVEVREQIKVEPTAAQEPQQVLNTTDEAELVSVITAAIAASLNTTSDKLIVRSIRKVNSWKKESIRQKNNGLF